MLSIDESKIAEEMQGFVVPVGEEDEEGEEVDEDEKSMFHACYIYI